MSEAAPPIPPASSDRLVPAAVDVIRAKRDGVPLSGHDIDWVIGAYLRGEVAEEQMSALLMAIYFRGLEPAGACQGAGRCRCYRDLPEGLRWLSTGRRCRRPRRG